MRAIYAFIRTLEKQFVPYYIIASSTDDEIYETAYKNKVVSIRQEKKLDLDDVVFCIQQVQKKVKADYYLISPSTEALNRFILDNKKIFYDFNCEIPLVEKNLYEKISDKYSFSRICEKHYIQTPKQYFFSNIVMPCVAKPKEYRSKTSGKVLKPVIILNNNDLDIFLSKFNVNDFYFQEFIEGRSIYLLYYFYKNNTCLKYSQENLIQQKGGGSILAAQSGKNHNTGISKLFEDLFYSIGFYGLVMVEIREGVNHTYMIEANPRFWGPSQLFVEADVNFFNALLYEYGFLSKKPNDTEGKSNSIYFWDDGQSFNEENIDETIFYSFSKQDFLHNYVQWDGVNMLRREDTMKVHNKLINSGCYEE